MEVQLRAREVGAASLRDLTEEGMRESRRHSRHPVQQRVWCEGDELTLYVQALNVSSEGMFVRTASPSSMGQRFRVSFSDFENGDIVANVEVVWTQTVRTHAQPGMGVRIVGFEKGCDSFSRYVARHATTTELDEQQPHTTV